MFKKILIANRGEIALRIVRACREMSIRSVAVHSVVDADSLHVKFADEAICIGPAPAQESYLSTAAIISAAEVSGADAIHPGYGFLAENAAFAETCANCNIAFIGPPPALMRLLGDKISARLRMAESRVPILPGSGRLESATDAIARAERIGFPVMLKAAAGGGGRGMKIVNDAESLPASYELARAEALAGFGSGDLYAEKYLPSPRHIEVQMVADAYGQVVALSDRECSIQRRHQKILEEGPAAVLTDEARATLFSLCERACRDLGYQNVGTFEFLFDRGNFYFMEVNPRIQVEHTVTEMVTGLDLIREQILVAAGVPLSSPFARRPRPRGHAIEARIVAEDPETFAPSPGRISALHLPGGFGVRVDTHVYEGYAVPPDYDSLLAKLVVHAEDRPHAIARLRGALEEFVVEGIATNLALHRRIVRDADFCSGQLDTHFLERFAA